MSPSSSTAVPTRSQLVWLLLGAFLLGSVSTGGAVAAGLIRSEDIADGQVKRADLANDAVTGAKVRDGSIGARELTSPGWVVVATAHQDADACDAGLVATFCGFGQPEMNFNWRSSGGDWQPVRFRRDVTGTVEIEGVARGTFTPRTAFVLPEGYRPQKGHVFAVSCANKEDPSVNIAGRISVHPDGRVHWDAGDDCNPYLYFSFDGIRFATD